MGVIQHCFLYFIGEEFSKFLFLENSVQKYSLQSLHKNKEKIGSQIQQMMI